MMSSHSDLRKAIEQGDRSAVIRALDSGANIEEADMHGEPGLPLRIACFKGHYGIVAELIRRGANVKGSQHSGGPMRMATRGQHQEIIRLLIAHGADAPQDIVLPEASKGERRQRGDRRKRMASRYFGERRSSEDRRATLVRELELSAEQWTTYFANIPAFATVKRDDSFDEEASNVFSRVRD